MQSYTSVK